MSFSAIRNVTPDMSVDQIISMAGLDWTAVKSPLVYRNPGWKFGDKGQQYMKTGEYCLTRSDDGSMLAKSVGARWEPPANTDVLNVFDDFIRLGGMTWKGVGMANHGQIVFAQAQITEAYKIGDETMLPYLLAAASYRYGLATSFNYEDIAVVCENTLQMGMAQKKGARVSVTHRSKVDLEAVKDFLMISESAIIKRKAQGEALLKAKVEESDLKLFYSMVFPLTSESNVRNKELSRNAEMALLLNESADQPGQAMRGNTWWRALNTVTYMSDHKLSRNEESRLYNSRFGTGRKIKSDALNFALKFAGVSDDSLYDIAPESFEAEAA